MFQSLRMGNNNVNVVLGGTGKHAMGMDYSIQNVRTGMVERR